MIHSQTHTQNTSIPTQPPGLRYFQNTLTYLTKKLNTISSLIIFTLVQINVIYLPALKPTFIYVYTQKISPRPKKCHTSLQHTDNYFYSDRMERMILRPTILHNE